MDQFITSFAVTMGVLSAASIVLVALAGVGLVITFFKKK